MTSLGSQILAEDVSFHMKNCLYDLYQNWSIQRSLSLIGPFCILFSLRYMIYIYKFLVFFVGLKNKFLLDFAKTRAHMLLQYLFVTFDGHSWSQ